MSTEAEVAMDESYIKLLSSTPQEDDKALIVRFYLAPVLLGAKSEEAGKPMYEDREHIEITIKGQDKQIVVREVTRADRERFPIGYARFKAQRQEAAVGTPIEMMPGVGPSFALHLRSIHIRTVEDLAQISDESALQNIGMGARELVTKARAWIANQSPQLAQLEEKLSEATAQTKRVAAQNEELTSANAELRSMIAGFEARFKELEGSGKATEKRPSARQIKKAAKTRKTH